MNIQQIKASDPKTSVWVSASAGTGKTKILTDRVLRLLLDGQNLNKILCLTFTNAAATEMKERIIDTIFHWSQLDFRELSHEIEKAEGTPPSIAKITRAASLYGEYLSSDNSLNVQTIHSFCQKLLQQFPIEAGISPNFQIIDETKEYLLLHELKEQIMQQPSLKEVNDYLILNFHELIIDEILEEIIQNKEKFLSGSDHQNIICGQNIVAKLSIRKEEFLQKFDSTTLSDIMGYDLSLAEIKTLFLTNSGDKRKRLSVPPSAKKNSSQYEELLALQEDFYQLDQQFKNKQLKYFSQLIQLLSQKLITEYNQIKQKKALLDYNDLIEKSKEILCNSNVRDWILYKLDGFIDHLLVDEAQDTSPQQWEIIHAIINEFYSGEGQGRDRRSVFVVGDAKQSIFSFQGADVDVFIESNIALTKKMHYGQKQFQNVELDISYRSAPEILAVVDKLFNDVKQHNPHFFQSPVPKISAFRKEIKGCVELWPLFTTTNKEQAFWPIVTGICEEEHGINLLAQHLASQIKQMLDSKMILSATNQVIRPKDIMILVRKRDQLTKKIIEALEAKGLHTSGFDRINLKENRVIQDLLNLARFAILPQDDLNLASILVSPLMRLSEKDLEIICLHNKKQSLWRNLLQLQEEQTLYKEEYGFLLSILKLYENSNNVDFFQYVVEFTDYKERVISAYEKTQEDSINELLQICLNYKQQIDDSLQNFLFWIDNLDTSIKRENLAEDQIEIMTVHGAKGLQSPIVFLCDTTSTPNNINRFFWDEGDFIATKTSEDNSEYLKSVKEKYKDTIYAEYLRLLYVAMTRAEEKLIICGYQGNKSIAANCWYQLAKDSMAQMPHVQNKEGRLIYGHDSNLTYAATTTQITSVDNIAKDLFYPYISKNNLAKLNVVSQKSDISIIDPLTAQNPLQYGLVFHKILEDVINAREFEYIRDHPLINTLSNKEQKRIYNNITKLEQNLEFQRLIKLKSIPELTIGELNSLHIVDLKRLDLAVFDQNEVIIIDYKTDQRPARSLDEVPESYINQLQNYHALCRKIYPNNKVTTKILWLESGELLDIPR